MDVTKRPRIEAVDLLRGLVMILMALDHTRDFFGQPGANPTNLATTTVPLFFSRWITHFCAPVFSLLTGTGAYLALGKKSKVELSRFLFTRGLWLIFLELTLSRLGWQFNLDYHVTMIVVLWSLGWSMIVLSALIYLPLPAIATFAAVMIAGHNLLDPIQSTNRLFLILHSPGFLLQSPQRTIFLAYPLIPWIAVTAVGYCLGQIYKWPAERRRRFLLRLGLGMTVGFIAIRAINVYGDPNRWSAQNSAAFTVISFLNTTKYPPSLLFLLMTLGPAMLFLAAVDATAPRWLRPALVFGKVPMFYYLLHVPLIHLIAIAFCFVRYHQIHWMFESDNLGAFPITPPPGWGYSLPVVYLVWISVVIALYPLCRWFATTKQRRKDAWLSYF